MSLNNSRNKTPWPTKDAMKQIYTQKLWGEGATTYYSGKGSHDDALVKPYVSTLSQFFQSISQEVVLVDLGCGDFNVGRQLLPFVHTYTGVDIVPGLIEYNKKHYTTKHSRFDCIDIAVDELPAGNVVVLRQVLQHLSNKEVGNILQKLGSFKYLILTEHVPLGSFIPNRDIISGQGIRLKKDSGVDISKPPFNFKYTSKIQLLSIPDPQGNGQIQTILYEIF